jgi:hypothetical protein
MDTETKNEILRSCPNLGEAVNKAAQHLPTGYQVVISVEHEGYGVELSHPNGFVQDIDGDGVVACVNDAIAIANGIAH